MGTGEFAAGGNPAMDKHPIHEGVEIRISSGLMGHLARMHTLPFNQYIMLWIQTYLTSTRAVNLSFR